MNDRTEHFRKEGKHIREDARELATDLGELMEETECFIRDQAIHRPYVTLGAAFGIGYVLGGGLPKWLVRSLVAVGGKVAFSAIAGEVARAASRSTAEPQQQE